MWDLVFILIWMNIINILIISRTTNIRWRQCWPISGGVCTLHWPAVSDLKPSGSRTVSHHGSQDDMWWSVHQDILRYTYLSRDLGENDWPAGGEVRLLMREVTFSLCLTVLVSLVLLKCLIIRWDHSSWASPSGLILLGSEYGDSDTTEKIQPGGTSTASFRLQHSTE